MRRFTRLSVLPAVLAPMALLGAVPAQAATSPSATTGLNVPGLTVGTEDSAGYVYAVGPAAIIALLCTDHLDIGAVCAFTGDDETGTGVFIEIGNDFNVTTDCADIPLPDVKSINNVTTGTLSLGDGTCANPGALDATVPDNTPKNVPPADAQI